MSEGVGGSPWWVDFGVQWICILYHGFNFGKLVVLERICRNLDDANSVNGIFQSPSIVKHFPVHEAL